MSKKSGYIQSSFIPEGMEYREEYMLDALTLYQNHKTKIRRRRLFYGLAALAILTTSLFFVILDRDTQKKASDDIKKLEPQTIIHSGDSVQSNHDGNSSVAGKNAIGSENSTKELKETARPAEIISSTESKIKERQKVETTTENSALTSSGNKKETNGNNGAKNNENQLSSIGDQSSVKPSDNLSAINNGAIKKEKAKEKTQDVLNNTKVIVSNFVDVLNSQEGAEKRAARISGFYRKQNRRACFSDFTFGL
jgi:hypothetical protein